MLGSNLCVVSRHYRFLFLAAVFFLASVGAEGKVVVEWDFTEGTLGWSGNARVERLKSSGDGLAVRATGTDPWIEGPAVELPGSEVARVSIRMKSTADAGAQLFYGRTFSEEMSARFTVRNDGKWHDYSVVIQDKLIGPTRFRLDPCGSEGELTIAHITVEAIGKMFVPGLEKPQLPQRAESPWTVKSGSLVLEHYEQTWGNFVIKANRKKMAAGHTADMLGIVVDDKPEWLMLADAKMRSFERRPGGGLTSIVRIKDSAGAQWQMQRTVTAGSEGTLLVEVELTVDKGSRLLHVPWLTIFPGLDTFGERKSQGLLPGLEYLCDEPSSSTADIAEPKNVRRVADPIKIAFPLMAIASGGNYVGVIWEPSEIVTATFDSPDRVYNSGAHLMGLSAPSVGNFRFENAFCAHSPFKIKAGERLKVSASIIGGEGKTVIEAVKKYVELRGLPDVPQFEGGLATAVNTLAHGWLDSQINEGALFRHAVWGSSFRAQPAADAAMYIDWLADFVEDKNLRGRLDSLKTEALGKIPAEQPFSSTVGHVRLPSAPFMFGRLAEYVRQKRNRALGQFRQFDEQGILHYRPGKADYAKTHFARHANGLGGRVVADILESAVICADKELIAKALELLDKQTPLYADTVPRGAQTWEMPLHTPDILASAHMVKAYTLGYILSNRKEYLEQARYWAWTGVPFVYLYPPTKGRVGVYSTTAVLGATNWKAPIWFGQPVQWCGLAYCSSLHLLSEVDPEGPWKKIAKGITATGLQMTWPTSDAERQGLLPDYFHFVPQIASGPAINPGTVQAHIPEYFAVGKMYDFKKLPRTGWFVHAPCKIEQVKEARNMISFRTDGRGRKQYHVLITGIEREPAEVTAANPLKEALRFGRVQTEYHSDIKALIIPLNNCAQVKIKP
ncbi:MAG: hypothetical protein ACYS8Z_05430 [Planctomycetota bacterium]|jgi:hypothetical protein